jgi:hypothetical protein
MIDANASDNALTNLKSTKSQKSQMSMDKK